MFRFLHAADLHLDTQPDGMHGYPDEVAELLRDSSLEAFDNLVQEAIAREVAFCVFAGDIYDGAERGARAELAFRRGLERLADNEIRSFIVHGNHDPLEQGWSTVREWPQEWVTVFEAGEPQTVTFEVDGTSVAVHGVSFARRDTTENLAVTFSSTTGADFQVGLLHANVGANEHHDSYAPCSVEDLRGVGLDYWALGHIHLRQSPNEGDPWVVYPGNLQGRSPKPSERGAKGAVIVEVDSGTAQAPEFIELDILRFETGAITIDDLADLGDLGDELTTAADELRDRHPGRPLIVRMEISGRGPVHSLLRRNSALGDVLDQLREDGRQATPLVWWDRLRDTTRPDLDLAELGGQDDFVGNALRAIDDMATDDDTLAEVLAELEKIPNFAKLDVTLPDLEDPELIERSRLMAVDLLVGDERP